MVVSLLHKRTTAWNESGSEGRNKNIKLADEEFIKLFPCLFPILLFLFSPLFLLMYLPFLRLASSSSFVSLFPLPSPFSFVSLTYSLLFLFMCLPFFRLASSSSFFSQFPFLSLLFLFMCLPLFRLPSCSFSVSYFLLSYLPLGLLIHFFSPISLPSFSISSCRDTGR